MIIRLTENFKFGIVAVVTLSALNYWSFRLISDGLYKGLEFASCLGLLVIVLFNTKVFLRKNLKFKINVLLFLFLPLLSVIGANLYHDQPIGLSLLVLRLNLFWLLYFVLHIYNIPSEKILKLLIICGCVWAFVTIVQQFTFPLAFFYTRGEGSASLHRADILRFMPEGQMFGIFVLLYFFYKYLVTKKAYTLYFIGLALGGIYYFGTRQGSVAAVASMLAAVLLIKGNSKWGYLILFGVLAVFIILIVQPTMITHYIQLTSEQMDNEDYIRFLSIDFFLNDYWPHWSAKFIGNGKPHLSSDYGEQMNYFSSVLGFWRSDVGIFGTYNEFGLFYVLNILWVNIKGIFVKINSSGNKYLKLLFIYPTILLPLSVGYAQSSVMCFFCLVYYLMDKSLEDDNLGLDRMVNPSLTKQLVSDPT